MNDLHWGTLMEMRLCVSKLWNQEESFPSHQYLSKLLQEFVILGLSHAKLGFCTVAGT
jgi:hypothetical protein